METTILTKDDDDTDDDAVLVFFLKELEEKHVQSRRTLYLYRLHLLNSNTTTGDGSNHPGFAAVFVPILRDAVTNFVALLSSPPPVASLSSSSSNSALLSEHTSTKHVVRILTLYLRIAQLQDSIVNEELTMEGSHRWLSVLVQLDMYACWYPCGSENNTTTTTTKNEKTEETNQDTIIAVQDLAADIGSYSKPFPVRGYCPILYEELRARLPLIFTIQQGRGCTETIATTAEEAVSSTPSSSSITIYINQVLSQRQSAQQDVGFVMWPAAVILSRYLVTNPNIVVGVCERQPNDDEDDEEEEEPAPQPQQPRRQHRRRRILELGAGCGLSGLVAAKIIQQHYQHNDERAATDAVEVVLSDFNETVLSNIQGNIELNELCHHRHRYQYTNNNNSNNNNNYNTTDDDDDDDDDDDGGTTCTCSTMGIDFYEQHPLPQPQPLPILSKHKDGDPTTTMAYAAAAAAAAAAADIDDTGIRVEDNHNDATNTHINNNNAYDCYCGGSYWKSKDGTIHTELFDLVLAADVICQPSDAYALARSKSNVVALFGINYFWQFLFFGSMLLYKSRLVSYYVWNYLPTGTIRRRVVPACVWCRNCFRM